MLRLLYGEHGYGVEKAEVTATGGWCCEARAGFGTRQWSELRRGKVAWLRLHACSGVAAAGLSEPRLLAASEGLPHREGLRRRVDDCRLLEWSVRFRQNPRSVFSSALVLCRRQPYWICWVGVLLTISKLHPCSTHVDNTVRGIENMFSNVRVSSKLHRITGTVENCRQ
jgi:hypothetical protein